MAQEEEVQESDCFNFDLFYPTDQSLNCLSESYLSSFLFPSITPVIKLNKFSRTEILPWFFLSRSQAVFPASTPSLKPNVRWSVTFMGSLCGFIYPHCALYARIYKHSVLPLCYTSMWTWTSSVLQPLPAAAASCTVTTATGGRVCPFIRQKKPSMLRK